MSNISEFEITAGDEGNRLDKFLVEKLKISRSKIQTHFENGLVVHNNKPGKPGSSLKRGDTIQVLPELVVPHGPHPENLPLDIIFEDEHIILINKPAGMMVHSNNYSEQGTLVNALLFHLGKLPDTGDPERPGIVHRLDKNTSGIIMVAKTIEAYEKLVEMFKNRQINKEYLALVNGEVKEENGEINIAIERVGELSKMKTVKEGGKPSLTTFQKLKQFNGYTLLSVAPKTGRTHQIRVHLKAIGHTIVCDDLYSNDYQKYCVLRNINGVNKKVILLDRQALHAQKISFLHPISKLNIEYSAPVPNDINNVLFSLENSEKRIPS